MTRTLPDRAPLLDVPIERRHTPTIGAEHARAYEAARPCLRWEFFFTCPFCLLHEAQICPTGAAGSSQFWIEHLATRSQQPELRSAYDNLVYACRRCNLARGVRPQLDGGGSRLLDPCNDAWSAHFEHDGDELSPKTPSGCYTAETYDINSPPKVALRHGRREAIAEALHVLATVPSLLDEVMATINLQPRQEQRLRLGIAEHLHKAVAAARRTLIQLSAVPHDAGTGCACGEAPHEPPSGIAETLLDLDLEPGRQ